MTFIKSTNTENMRNVQNVSDISLIKYRSVNIIFILIRHIFNFNRLEFRYYYAVIQFFFLTDLSKIYSNFDVIQKITIMIRTIVAFILTYNLCNCE